MTERRVGGGLNCHTAVRHVAEVEFGLAMLRSWTGHNLSQEGSLQIVSFGVLLLNLTVDCLSYHLVTVWAGVEYQTCWCCCHFSVTVISAVVSTSYLYLCDSEYPDPRASIDCQRCIDWGMFIGEIPL